MSLYVTNPCFCKRSVGVDVDGVIDFDATLKEKTARFLRRVCYLNRNICRLVKASGK